MKAMKMTALFLSALLTAAGNLCLTANAASAELAETISENITVWGSRNIVNDVYKEIDDPTILPEKMRDVMDAIRVENRLLGLAFRVDGVLPETIGNYHVHYFQDYFPYDQEKHDAFKQDADGCFVASYAYYERYLENRFPSYWRDEGTVWTPIRNSSTVELSETDSIVILMLEFPEDAQADAAAKEAYFRGAEKAFLSCPQLSYLGEARRIEETYYYNMHDPLRIFCTDADAALGLLDSEVLAPYDNKHISKSYSYAVEIDEVSTDDMRTLRAAVRQDPRVVSAQIEYSVTTGVADAGEIGVSNGCYVVRGDADGNGGVNLDDAITALQVYTAVDLMKQETPLKDGKFTAADTDGDGKVTMDDALAILQAYTKTLLK